MFSLESLSIEQVTLLVVGILVSISFITGAISFWLETDRTRQWFGDWFQGVSTEMIGAAMTTIFFTFIVGTVEQQQNLNALREDFTSTINVQALAAVEELAANDWLQDGTLRGITAPFANLENAPLFRADLAGANFFSANLQEAALPSANLRDANFQAADLSEADLSAVNLTNAYLAVTNLADANLDAANLNGADLTDSNLARASFEEAVFSEATILPDGTPYTTRTDLRRFTDPTSPDFWRPVGDPDDLPWWMASESDD